MFTIPLLLSHARRTGAPLLLLLGLTLGLLAATAPSSVADPAEHTYATRASTSVAAGQNHACALSAEGMVRCWGSNSDGQLGIGLAGVGVPNLGDDEAITKVGPVNLRHGRTATAVDAGASHTCALLDDGTVQCWGRNSQGQLGTDTDGEDIGDDESVADSPTVHLGRDAVAISTGANHSCAILSDGKLRCWGANDRGQLGIGTTDNLGDDEHPAVADPVYLGIGRTARAVSAGAEHTCAILDNGHLRCWGANQHGQLGAGNDVDLGDNETVTAYPPIDLGPGRTAVAVSAAGFVTCVVLDNGQVRCWGSSERGSVGVGTPEVIGDDESVLSVEPVFLGLGSTAVGVFAGRINSCALLASGQLRCWGSDEYGQLAIADNETIGDDEATILPNIPLGAGRTVKGVAVGGSGWICATLDAAETQCWGYGNYGQLGTGDDANVGDDELPTHYGPARTGFGARIDPVATGITRKATPVRDRSRPYVFTLTGRLTGDLPRHSCGGTVTVEVSGRARIKGTRTRVPVAGTAKAPVVTTDAGCSYRAKVTVRAVGKRHARKALVGRVVAKATYGGGGNLKGSQTSVRLRLG